MTPLKKEKKSFQTSTRLSRTSCRECSQSGTGLSCFKDLCNLQQR